MYLWRILDWRICPIMCPHVSCLNLYDRVCISIILVVRACFRTWLNLLENITLHPATMCLNPPIPQDSVLYAQMSARHTGVANFWVGIVGR